MTENMPLVGVLMGSDSDFDTMRPCFETLQKFDVAFEARVISAHRTPERAIEYSKTARERGLKVIIAGAGAAAHLAGVIASSTTLPVLGVPISATSLQGFDALLATVQMPGGVPVATFAVGSAGATNAALFAIQIISTSDETLALKFKDFKDEMPNKVGKKDEKLQTKIAEFLKNNE